GPHWPSLVCSLLVFVVLSCLCPSWLPPAKDRTPASYPCSPEQTRSAHTLKSGMERDANLIPVCVARRPLATGDPCRVRQGSAPRSGAPGTLMGRAAGCERDLMASRAVHASERRARLRRRTRAAGSAGRQVHRQAMRVASSDRAS